MEQLFNKFYSFSIEFRSLFEKATQNSFWRDSNSQITLKQGKTEFRFYILARNAIRKKRTQKYETNYEICWAEILFNVGTSAPSVSFRHMIYYHFLINQNEKQEKRKEIN